MRSLPKRYWITGLVVLALATAIAWLVRPVPLSGPWRAQIVDAETGQPLEGVIVLALWDKRSFGWPHPDRNYHDIDEVVSDKDGRIVIPARDTSGRHPFEKIIGPIITIFKPGYSRWRFQGAPANPFDEDAVAAKQRSTAAWERFAHEGIVILLPRAKTREERQRVLDHVLPGWDVPPEKIARTRDAYDRELIALGMRPRFREGSK